ncbi:MAG: nitrophenyl compound nitroreductase subunit ArsF family protein [Patescibacteria group bacterium]
MNKKIIIGITVLVLFGMIAVMAKNNNQQPNISATSGVASEATNENQTSSVKNFADKIEVYYFHRTQRCYSCNTLGQYARETVEQRFSEEMKNGRIDFREINVDSPENKGVAVKFQASGSSLFINAIQGEQDNISQDVNVWRLLRDETKFKNYLANKVNSLLGK